MAKTAIVGDDLAQKFATEKDTPYLRWVREDRKSTRLNSSH